MESRNGGRAFGLAEQQWGAAKCSSRSGPAHTADSGIMWARLSVLMGGCRTFAYTNTRKLTGVTAEKFEGNVAALNALVAALDVAAPKPKNWTVCHIWGYDDPSFAQGSSVVQNPRYFSCVANTVWLPTSLKGFTDTLPEIKAMLRVCSFHLYGWACEHEAVAAQAEQVRSGWTPPDYPRLSRQTDAHRRVAHEIGRAHV